MYSSIKDISFCVCRKERIISADILIPRVNLKKTIMVEGVQNKQNMNFAILGNGKKIAKNIGINKNAQKFSPTSSKLETKGMFKIINSKFISRKN